MEKGVRDMAFGSQSSRKLLELGLDIWTLLGCLYQYTLLQVVPSKTYKEQSLGLSRGLWNKWENVPMQHF